MPKFELFKSNEQLWRMPNPKPCQLIVNSVDIMNPEIRMQFPALFYELCTLKKMEGGFLMGEISCKEGDGTETTVKTLHFRNTDKINDPILTFVDADRKIKIALREKEPKLYIIPNDIGTKPYAEELDEEGLRTWLQKAMDVFYKTLPA